MTPHRLLGLLASVALLMAACGGAGPPATIADDDVLGVFGNYRGADADAFVAVLDAFTDETGIPTRYVGTAGFASRIQARVRDGDPPDVALIPQPAVIAELARSGYLAPADEVQRGLVEGNYPDWAVDLVTVDGRVYGAMFRLSVKSLVWYPPQVFADLDYGVPSTWSELESLTGRMRADGYTPWCLGMESFDATGWVGTDWVEDLVLRLHGPEVFDRWAQGEVPFTDLRIEEAFAEFGEVALAPGQVAGGTRAILTVPALAAINPMFEDPPGCLLTRQASFQQAALPDDVRIGPEGDVDVFVLPPIGDGDAPLLTSGEIATAFTDTEEARALMAFLASPAAGEPWAARGGYNSPHVDFDAGAHANTFERRLGQLVREAPVVRFDASDQMAPAVGTGTFWTGVVDFVAGSPLDRVLADIEAGGTSR